MLLSTIILGVIFLGFRALSTAIHRSWLWLYLDVESYNALSPRASLVLVMTFLTGLVMLTLVYVRLELGHFNQASFLDDGS